MGHFMWTFEGVCKAVGIGLVALAFLAIGIIAAVLAIQDWWRFRKTRGRR